MTLWLIGWLISVAMLRKGAARINLPAAKERGFWIFCALMLLCAWPLMLAATAWNCFDGDD